MRNRHYRHAVYYAGAGTIPASVLYLDWNFHMTVPSGVVALLLISVAGVVVEIRRGRKVKAK